jgi:phosphatidylinositol kinase/protein kinase (PI-3  family)
VRTRDMSPTLFHMFDGSTVTPVEIPGQYNSIAADSEPMPARHVRICSILPYAPIVSSPTLPGALARRVGFLGDDGKRHFFSITVNSNATMNTEQRMVQLINTLNMLMQKYPDARSRNLQITPESFIFISNKQRLVADSLSVVSFHNLLEQHMAAQPVGNIETPEDLITYFRGRLLERLQTEPTEDLSTLLSRLSLSAFKDVCDVLPATSLSRSLAANMASAESFAALRNRMIPQYAASSALGYHLSVIDRNPSRLLVDRATGNFISSEFRLTFPASAGGSGLLPENAEAVPFRLTRNVATLFTPQGILGPFAAAFCAHNRAQFSYSEQLSAVLCVVLWDECLDNVHSRILTQAGRSADAMPPVPEGADPAAALHTFASLPGIPSRYVHRRVLHNQMRWFDRATELQSPTISSKIVTQNMQGPAPMAEMLSTKGHALIEQAMLDRNAARMSAQWHPWY